MQRLSMAALLVLAVACDDGDTDKTTDTEPTSSSSDSEDTEVPQTETDCGDGVDEDLDGLIDCEDADCVDDDACLEDCDSEGDEDGDGLADCADDECWATAACPLATVQVTGGQGSRVVEFTSTTWFNGSSGTSWVQPGGTTSVEVTQEIDGLYVRQRIHNTVTAELAGVVAVQSGTGSVSCGWGANLLGYHQSETSFSKQISSASDHTFTDFTTSGACGGLSSWFLPTQLDLARDRNVVALDHYGSQVEWLVPQSSTNTRTGTDTTYFSSQINGTTTTSGGAVGQQFWRASVYQTFVESTTEWTLGEGPPFVMVRP